MNMHPIPTPLERLVDLIQVEAVGAIGFRPSKTFTTSGVDTVMPRWCPFRPCPMQSTQPSARADEHFVASGL
jgi:hypothetical protein